MLLLETSSSGAIAFKMDVEKGELNRMPNQLIWSINSLLAKHFDLYEYYFAMKRKSDIALKLGLGRWLCFAPLHPMYIELLDYDEDEFRKAYLNSAGEVESYEEFFEVSTMEVASELEYIGVKDLKATLSVLEKGKYPVSGKWHIKDMIEAVVPAYGCIVDNEYMYIHVKDPELRQKICDIVKPYTVAAADKTRAGIDDGEKDAAWVDR